MGVSRTVTKKPAGHVFMKVTLKPELLRDFDDALRYHGLHRGRNWAMTEMVRLFIEMTKEAVENGENLQDDTEH